MNLDFAPAESLSSFKSPPAGSDFAKGDEQWINMNAPVDTSMTRPKATTNTEFNPVRRSKTCPTTGYVPNAGPRKNILKKSSSEFGKDDSSRNRLICDRLYQSGLKAAYWAARCFFYIFRPRTLGVNVALWRRDRLLVIRNSYKPEFTLPGGYRKGCEDPRDTAVRETEEEVGLKIPRHDLTLVGQAMSDYEHKRETVTFFEYNLPSQGEVQIDGREVVWARFLNPREISSLPCSPHLVYYLEHLKRHA